MRIFVGLAVVAATSASAEPLSFSHQGRVTGPSGLPITGNHDVAVTLYDSGGAVVWTQSYAAVPFDDGFYSVVLGTNGSLDLDDLVRAPLFVGVALDGGAELANRQELLTVPYGGLAAGVRLGMVTTCGTGQAGLLRWNGTAVQVCNGTSWGALLPP
jgi:hypothetical protein